MSRGIGKQQQDIKRLLNRAYDCGFGMLSFASIRAVFIVGAGGNPETDRLNPAHERSLKRSLRALIDRGDVIRLGEGGQRDPFRYTTVEAFTDEPNTDEAKRALTEMSTAAARFGAYMAKHGTTPMEETEGLNNGTGKYRS